MRVGEVEAKSGTKAFGYLQTAASRSGLSPDIPMHVIAGGEPGPTLLLQGAIHGSEIIGTIAILNFVKRIDPQQLRGTVIAVPVTNRMGFELSDRGSRIDGKDISRLFPGNPKGSVSDQVAHVYFNEVIRRANVMVDFHAGGQTAYERYVLFSAEADANNLTDIERNRRKLIVAFGLDQAAFFPQDTFGANKAKEAIENAGVCQFTLEFGGGTGWFKSLSEMKNTRDAIVIPSGQEWPTVGMTSIGILGIVDRVEDRRTTDLYATF